MTAGNVRSGDSYIILHSYLKNGNGAMVWDVHFWIGALETLDSFSWQGVRGAPALLALTANARQARTPPKTNTAPLHVGAGAVSAWLCCRALTLFCGVPPRQDRGTG